MADHPKTQTARMRTETFRMIDAFRMLERDLHHRLLEIRTIPSEWHEIHETLPERHPRKTRVTAAFDADVVKFFKGLGRGYQERMNLVLRAYMHGRLSKVVEGPDTVDYILRPETIPEEPEAWTWGQAEGELAKSRAERESREAELPPGLKAEDAAREARAEARFAEWKKKAAEAEAKGETPPKLF